jgi:hypothetical protein
MKKTVIFKTAFAAILVVLLALPLVTCQPELAESADDGIVEYTDVVYDYIGSGDNLRVKSVKLYLDGTKVPKTAQQRAVERALGLEGAKMGHDFFEVIFMHISAAPATTIARASWEIGQNAGISGVERSGAGVNYGTVQVPIAGQGGAVIFVGKKQSKTLLGVGKLTHVEDNPAVQLVDPDTKSVTFSVYALHTWLGFASLNNVIASDTTDPVTTPGVGKGSTFIPNNTHTFITAAGVTGEPTPTVNPTSLVYATAAAGATTGNNLALRTGAPYPVFDLPSVKNWTPATIASATVDATYRIGGLPDDVLPGVLYYGMKGGTGTHGTAAAKGGPEFQKRDPAFMYEGQTWGVTSANTDKATTVEIDTTTYTATHGNAFNPVIPLIFKQTKQSGGVFAITFQIPVFAISTAAATNGGPAFEKWWIRPDYGQYQYLLDNGKDSGGAVLLATDIGGALDWIQIKTQGIGFSNE